VSDRARECPLYHFTAITRIPHVVLYGLQKEIERPQRSAKADEALSAVSQLGCDLHDFGDTAAVIDHLDLVISVDTSVAHLAGAMGKPVWVLLPRSAEWRWLLDRGDSPWYPTMRLFRQKTWGGWADVMDRIAAEIRKQPRVSPIG
jgi:ADP-heptose:LPS heptosyltransferase